MIELSIGEQLGIVALEAGNEIGRVVMVAALACLAVLLVVLIAVAASRTLSRIRERVGRLAPIAAFLVGLAAMPSLILGGTKHIAKITAFKAAECPDSVTFTWDEQVESGATIVSVQVQRRMLGLTGEDDWENWGAPIPGGAEAVTLDGFTLDTDYEYRLVYISTSED